MEIGIAYPIGLVCSRFMVNKYRSSGNAARSSNLPGSAQWNTNLSETDSHVAEIFEGLTTEGWTCDPPLYGLDVDLERGFEYCNKLYVVLKGRQRGIFSSWYANISPLRSKIIQR